MNQLNSLFIFHNFQIMERNVKFSYSGIDKNKILKAANSALPKGKAVNDYGLIFVSKQKMAELNKKYRHKKGATNVLSFGTGLSKELGAGTVVLCPKVAGAEAKEHGFTQKNWMTRLIVHGILHLAGYGHDTATTQKQMEGLEKIVLSKLGIKNV
ncbi:MAG: rRNA maturation RNase YbeY [Parcubacteria group bacterium]|nr:rRNA maturation RNase YbeY [Parcubacteria group bacterium]